MSGIHFTCDLSKVCFQGMMEEINCSHPHAYLYYIYFCQLLTALKDPGAKLVFSTTPTLSRCCCPQQLHVKEIRMEGDKAPPAPGHPCQLSSQTWGHTLLQGGIIRGLCAAEMQPVFSY